MRTVTSKAERSVRSSCDCSSVPGSGDAVPTAGTSERSVTTWTSAHLPVTSAPSSFPERATRALLVITERDVTVVRSRYKACRRMLAERSPARLLHDRPGWAPRRARRPGRSGRVRVTRSGAGHAIEGGATVAVMELVLGDAGSRHSGRLIAAVRAARLARTLVRLERRQHPGALHPALWRRGFLSSRAYLYPDIADPSVPYLSDVAVERRLPHVNAPTARLLLEDKLVFYETLVARGLGQHSPEVFGVVLRGRFRPRSLTSTERLRRQDRVVVKPVSGSGGRDVRVVAGPDLVAAVESAGVDVLVQELVAPALWAGSSSTCLNTMRLVVVRPRDGRPLLAGAVHRFGTAASGSVDNVSAGGLCSRIDLADGRLSPAVGLPHRARRVEHDVHPDTGHRLTGVRVPRWPEVRDLALTLMAGFPEADHVGWDLCLSDRGPLVLEGNGTTPNLNVLQFHGPFLQDDKVRDFYASHGLRP